MLTGQVDPANRRVFRAVFGMTFTAIVALEFRHSLLVVPERRESVLRARSAMLFPLLAAAVPALGLVHRLARDQDRRALLRPGRAEGIGAAGGRGSAIGGAEP